VHLRHKEEEEDDDDDDDDVYEAWLQDRQGTIAAA
jgi:hypothetical protein